MKPRLLYILFILFISKSFYAQESINAKLIDSTSKNPIPYATIAFNKTSGVISNENGDFLIYLNRKIKTSDSLFISCLGYDTKRIGLENFKDSIIVLSNKSIELKEVLVSNENYSIEEIIEKVKENLSNNYDFEFTMNKLFYRESYTTDILKSAIKIKESTIPEFNQKFFDSLISIVPKKSDNYTEILGVLYKKPMVQNSQKLDIIKASTLYDKNNEVTFTGLEEKFSKIFKKHIKRDSYFKIKSGIFGTKENIDSSFFDDKKQKEEVEQTKALIEEQKKRETQRKKNFLKHRKHTITNLEKSSFMFEDSHLNFLEKYRRYDFKLLDYIFLNDNFVYKITFTPKRKEDYKGTIYVNTDDFAIIRIDYENVKSLKTFRLLGISMDENLKKGTYIYAKNSTEKYALKYAEMESGSKFGVKRPLRIIEKNKHTKGRRKQNEISSDLHFIVSNITKKELVVFENEPIAESQFNSFSEKANVTPTYLPKYDPDFWKGYNVIEPNQAIKDFKSIE